jgi:MFS family permease
VQGIGGLTGGLTASRVVRRYGEVATITIGLGLFVVALAGLLYANLILGFAASIVLGAGIPYVIVAFNTLMQRVTPAAVLGRVSAAAEAVISTPQALSIAAGAALVAVLDYRFVLLIMAAGMAVSGAYLWKGRRLSPPLTPARAVPAPARPADEVPITAPNG